MSLFSLFAVLVTIVAVLGWVNRRWLRLPPAIGLTALAFLTSQILVLAGNVWPGVLAGAQVLVRGIDLDDSLLRGMLGFILFAGALRIDAEALGRNWRIVSILAVVGVLVSTLIVGGLVWLALAALGQPLPLVLCLLFGALISPTDPVAVLAVLKALRVPADLEGRIAGEALFNDGIGIVLYVGLLQFATSVPEHPVRGALLLFLREAGGGALLGLAAGWLVYRMMRKIDDYRVEVPLTVALVSGGFALAGALDVSGPIAMVAAGLLIGKRGREYGMSEVTSGRLDDFWELIEDMLNAALFVIIGLYVVALPFTWSRLIAGGAAIGIVLVARALSAGAAGLAFRLDRCSLAALVWGGVRGAIAIALALGLASKLPRDVTARLTTMTYVVVTFSLLVQAPTLRPLLRRALGGTAATGAGGRA